MRIAIFGGSFNPFHNGHLFLIESVLKLTPVRKIILVPSAITPLKKKPTISDQHRIEMLKRVLLQLPHCELSLYEIEKAKVSYTIKTIDYFKASLKIEDMWLLVGSDNFFTLHLWRDYLKIVEQIKILVINRTKIPVSHYNTYLAQHFSAELHSQFEFDFVEPYPVSSSQIRESCQQHLPIQQWVPNEISDYIQSHQLYLE